MTAQPQTQQTRCAPAVRVGTPVPEEVAAFLKQLVASGVTLTQDSSVPVVTTVRAATGQPAASGIVAPFDGRLTPEVAAVIEKFLPACLLATDADGRLREPDLLLLRAMLSKVFLQSVLPNPVQWRIAQISDVREAAEQVQRLAKKNGARMGAAAAAADVAYELAVNALLDAPADSSGAPKYAHRRAESPIIDPKDACRLSVAITAHHVYLAADDLFGRLRARHVAKVVDGMGTAPRVDASGGGAGLGLRRILEQADVLAVRVTSGRLSEVVTAVDLRDTRRRSGRMSSLLISAPGGP